MNKNTLYAVLWAVITLTSAPIIAMDTQSPTASMSVDEKASSETKRSASTSYKKKSKFECDWCHKQCNNSSTFKRHIVTHTGEKPFKCAHCGKSFARTSARARHMLTHGEPRLKCKEKECTRTFTTKDGRKRHMLTHTGEKPHKCTICGQSFAENRNLKKHVEKKHTSISNPAPELESATPPLDPEETKAAEALAGLLKLKQSTKGSV